MTQYVGNATTFHALVKPPQSIGNPVIFRAPKVWFMRATTNGLVPVQMARAAGGDVDPLNPA